MKKIGFLIFGAALIVGVVLANFTSFGSAAFKSPVSFVFGSKIHGSGNVVKESRNTGEFTGIEVGGILKVEVTQAEKVSVVVEADDNILPLVKTSVDGGTLKIWTEKRFKSRNRVVIRVSAPNITDIDTSGVAKVTFSGVNNESLNVESSGASKVILDGSVQSLSIEMSGASRIKASKLVAKKANVEGSGAASISLEVTSHLNADVSGASSISYSGDPAELKKSVSGAGSVSKLK